MPLMPGVAPIGSTGLAMGLPSRAVLLRNMFDPAEESEEGWEQDICEEVKEECEKHGPVVHVSVEKNSGVVDVLFRCGLLARAPPRLLTHTHTHSHSHTLTHTLTHTHTHTHTHSHSRCEVCIVVWS